MQLSTVYATERLAWIRPRIGLMHRYVKCTKGSRPSIDRFSRGFQRLVELLLVQNQTVSFFGK